MPPTATRVNLTDPSLLARLSRLSDVELRVMSFRWASSLIKSGVAGQANGAGANSAAAELAELSKPPFGDMARDSDMALSGTPTRREEAWMLANGRLDLLDSDNRMEFLRQRLQRIDQLKHELAGEKSSASPTSTLADSLYDQVQAERPPVDTSTATAVSFEFSPAQLAVVSTQPRRLEMWAAAFKSQQAGDEAAGRSARAWWSQDLVGLKGILATQAAQQMPTLDAPTPGAESVLH